jgi:tetratricopeptide (TPR) repeat protein
MKFKLIFFSVFLSISLFGQRAVEADALFSSKQYTKARGIYETLLKQKPNDPKFNFRYAQCCYELRDAEQAILHFEMAGSKFPQRDMYLSELYFATYRFDKSVIAYQNYLATLKPDDSKIQELQSKMAKSERAARLLTKVEDIAIVDSILVDKTDFLRFYKTSSELGTINQSLLKLNARRTVDKITYTTQRKDRVYLLLTNCLILGRPQFQYRRRLIPQLMKITHFFCSMVLPCISLPTMRIQLADTIFL